MPFFTSSLLVCSQHACICWYRSHCFPPARFFSPLFWRGPFFQLHALHHRATKSLWLYLPYSHSLLAIQKWWLTVFIHLLSGQWFLFHRNLSNKYRIIFDEGFHWMERYFEYIYTIELNVLVFVWCYEHREEERNSLCANVNAVAHILLSLHNSHCNGIPFARSFVRSPIGKQCTLKSNERTNNQPMWEKMYYLAQKFWSATAIEPHSLSFLNSTCHLSNIRPLKLGFHSVSLRCVPFCSACA